MKIDADILNYYNRSYLTESSTRGYYQEKKDFYESYLNIFGKNNKILDIACNDGKMTVNYKKYGEVLGIDINKRSIDLCRKKGLKCLLTNVEGLSKKYNDYFDVVIAGDIIEHVFDTDIFLRNIHRVLKKDGHLLLTTANLASFGRRLMLLFGKNPYIEYSTELPNKEFNVGHIRYYTVADMRLQLKVHKFKNIKIVGDRINLTKSIDVPQSIAQHLPNISRYMHVYVQK